MMNPSTRMRYGLSVAIGAVVVTAVSSMVSAQAPSVAVDQRIELIAIAFKLAGAPEYNQNRFETYIADIQRHFEAHRSHSAIAQVRTVREVQPLNFDAVMSLAVHLSQLPDLRTLVPFDRPPDRSRWQTPAAAALVDDVRRFAVESRAEEFFAEHRVLYDSASARLGRLVAREVEAAWFARFFGTPADQDFKVVPLLANSGTNFGPCAEPIGSRRTCYAIIGHTGTDVAGFPTYDRDLVSTLVHEFTHGYANAVMDERRAEFELAAARMFPLVGDAMREQGYGETRAMLNESLVRSIVAQYIRERQGPADLERYVTQQRAAGWLWVPEIAERLVLYAADRQQYASITTFMPRIVAYFDSLPARLPEMQRRFDATRPVVTALSIENGAETIDPATTQIVIQFDQRMQPGPGDVRAVGGRERLPAITTRGFDSTQTAFTLGVRLEPGRTYDFMLNRASGGRFTNLAGVPLAPYRIRFATRGVAPKNR